ncbi:MAG: GGDEF domain-containing protein [Dehalococcoidia bacterium]
MIAREIVNDRWRLGTAIAVAASLLAFGLMDLPGYWPDGVLGVPPQGWSTALAIVAGAAIVRFVWDQRVALRRERRLVEAAATLRLSKAKLAEEARTDSTTGLFNRRALDIALGTEFRRAQRYGRRLGVLMVDLDNFKGLNDTHGHAFGDLVLRTVASTLRANLRESDVLARYGGDEFVIVLPEAARGDSAAVGEKLRAAVAARLLVDGDVEARTTISVGVATYPSEHATSEADLLRLADEALLEAKRTGRDRTNVA